MQEILTMKKCAILLFACLLFTAKSSFAQTSIQLTRYPMFNFRISGVFDINIVNLTQQNKPGYLKASVVKKANNQAVAEITSSSITLLPGLNMLSSASINKTFTYYDSYSQTSDRIGMGEHEVCITFTETSAIEPASTACTSITPPSFSLPYLVYPYNESTSGDKHPNLMWSAALVQGGLEVKYQLELAEMLAGQAPNDAIINNYKLVKTDLLTANNLFYPATAAELAFGKSYAWQVTTYINGDMAGKTEVWSFNLVQDTPSLNEDNIPLNYIILNDLNLEGIYTTKDKKLYIELDEKYVHEQVSFIIYEDEGLKKQVCDITEKRKTGLNLYTLVFNACEKKLKTDVVYHLAVKSNNKVYRLKFRFKG